MTTIIKDVTSGVKKDAAMFDHIYQQFERSIPDHNTHLMVSLCLAQVGKYSSLVFLLFYQIIFRICFIQSTWKMDDKRSNKSKFLC